MTDISRAAELIRAGGLVAFPTETVYGLGADATNDHAVAKIYAAKGRPNFNPLIAHVEDVEQAFGLAQFPAGALTLAARFWPGPLTLVLPRKDGCKVSLLASAGLPSLAIRVPRHPLALELIRAVGRPVVAPSANASGRISPTTAQHVRDGLGAKVDLILDGGPSAVGLESTIVSFLDETPRLLRAGGLSREEIEQALGRKLEGASAGPIHAPGQLESHYAPSAQLRLNAKSFHADEARLGFGGLDAPLNLSRKGDVVEAAANLFAMLHQLDATKPKMIAVAAIPMQGLGEAINDRLRRAAAPRE
ncbi:MAG: L-threonylcarbamoyladenylate synthase [Pseudomonadota bacterium]|nr:L-threonylcarbamoyladenylate synthase [Pseudomonadota bacterium]